MSSALWVRGCWFKSQPDLQDLKARCGVNDWRLWWSGGLSRAHCRKTKSCRLTVEPGYFFISRHLGKMYNRCWSLSWKSPGGERLDTPPPSCPAFSRFTFHSSWPGDLSNRASVSRPDSNRHSSNQGGCTQTTEPLALPHTSCFFFGSVILFNWSNPMKLNNFSFARVRLELGSLR